MIRLVGTLALAMFWMGFGCCKQESKAASEPVAAVEPVNPGTKANAGEHVNQVSKKVAMIVAFEGFQHLEYGTPRQALEKAGFQVDVVSSKNGTALGTGEVKAEATLTLEDLLPNIGQYAAIVFVGGPGSPEFHKNPVAHKIAQQTVAQKKVLAAICLAPFTLAQAGVLRGVKATAWTDDEEFSPAAFKAFGPLYSTDAVVVDGLILTANGPAAAPQFGARLVELLSK